MFRIFIHFQNKLKMLLIGIVIFVCSYTSSMAQESQSRLVFPDTEVDVLIAKFKDLAAKTLALEAESSENLLLAEIESKSPKQILGIAKRTKVLLRKALNNVGYRLDKEVAGEITASAILRQSMFSLTLLGLGSSRGSLKLDGTFYSQLETEVYVVDLLVNAQNITTAFEQLAALSKEKLAIIEPFDFRAVRTFLAEHPNIAKNTDYYFSEIIPLRALLATLLDYLEVCDRVTVCTEQENVEFLRLLDWAQTTKVLANVTDLSDPNAAPFLPIGAKTITVYERKELKDFWQRGHQGEYTQRSVGVIYATDNAGKTVIYADGGSSLNIEAYLKDEGVTGWLDKPNSESPYYLKDPNLSVAPEPIWHGLYTSIMFDYEGYEVTSSFYAFLY